MSVDVRRGLSVAALFAIAGCSGGQSGTPAALSAGSGSGMSVVHRGIPFMPPARRNAVVRHTQSTYPTNKVLVFEADQEESAVNIYLAKDIASNPAPIATIHVQAGCPYGLATDKNGTLYVADNCGGNDVEEYPKGSTTVGTIITDGISNPLGLAIDKNQTLYVSNYPASITEYAYGTTTPSKTITGGGMSDPFGLALDKAGNLYIADFGASAVFELPAGGSSVTNLNLQNLGEPLGLAIWKKQGLLWETGGGGNLINVYKLGSTSPMQTITGNGDPYAISLENQGRLHGRVVESDLGPHVVYGYKPMQYAPYATLNNGVELPTGLLDKKP
ncbi:MAG: hypothetical protein JO104_02475 [Candidatus Eremiobacteraeota bacterium]|nr:hypothetical protein [Candidatus Eremiobacteraeota bacterium]